MLKTETEFRHFTGWLEQVREIHEAATDDTRPMQRSELKALEETQRIVTMSSPRQAPTDEWVPRLKDATVIGVEPPPVRGPRRPVGQWKIWPWNWFKARR